MGTKRLKPTESEVILIEVSSSSPSAEVSHKVLLELTWDGFGPKETERWLRTESYNDRVTLGMKTGSLSPAVRIFQFQFFGF